NDATAADAPTIPVEAVGIVPTPPPLPARPAAPIPPPLPTSHAGLLEWMTQAVVADGVVTDAERDLLLRAAARQRVAPAHLDAMIAAARLGQLSLPNPQDQREARQ